MLQIFSRFANSIVAKCLFGLLLVAFIIFGIGDVLRSGSTGNVVADVGSQQITVDQLNQAFRQRLTSLEHKFGGKLDEATVKRTGFMDHVLDAMIDEALIKQAVRDYKFIIGSKQVIEQIQKIPVFLDDNKQFDRDKFRRVLGANAIDEAGFVSYLKEQTASKLLADSELGQIKPPPLLVNALFRFKKEQRRGEIIRLGNAGMTVPPPTADQLTDYYHKHEDAFTAPEYRSFSCLLLTVGDVAKNITISPEEVKQAYDARQAEFQVPERRELEQVVLQDQAKAEALSASVKSAKGLADAATAGGAPKPTNLGLMAKTDLPDVLQEPVFTAAAGAVLPPIKTSFGWNVIQVDKIEPAHQISFDEAKAALAADLKAERAQDQLVEIEKKIDDQLAGGAKLAEAGAPYGVKPIVVTSVDATGKHPDSSEASELKDHPAILKAAGMATMDESGQMQEDSDGSAWAVQLSAITPPALRPFDTVKDKVRAAYLTDAREAAAIARAQQLLDKARGGTPFGNLPQEAGAILIPVGPLARDAQDKDVEAPVISSLFALKKTGDVDMVKEKDGPVLVHLSEIIAPPAMTPGETNQMQTSIEPKLQEDLTAEYNLALRQIYKVKMHDNVLQAMQSAN